MKWLKRAAIYLVVFYSVNAYSTVGPNYVSGNISNITSVTSGILVRVGVNQIPQNCSATDPWLHIVEENKSIISLTLATWAMGRDVVVYTSGTNTSAGLCKVIQVDPRES